MSNDERIAVLETTINHIDASLIGIKQDIKTMVDKIDGRLDKIESRADTLSNKIDNRFDKLNDRMWTLFFWMLGGFASVLAIVAHGFHWF